MKTAAMCQDACNPLAGLWPGVARAVVCFWIGITGTVAVAGPVALRCEVEKVGRYEKVEFGLEIAGTYTNAFDPDEVQVNLSIRQPGGETLNLPAFHCQNYERRRLGPDQASRDWFYPVGLPVWKARFAPTQTGQHTAVAVVKDRLGSASSQPVQFRCVDSPAKGFVRVSRKDPRFLEFSEGQPFFPIGQNLAFIGDQQYVSLSKAESIFGRLATNGANYLRIWTCCEDWAMALEARKSAWGRSWEWRAPVVPLPEGQGASRKCLQLSSSRPALEARPSHAVALRPSTPYVLSGKLRTEGEAALRLEVQHAKPGKGLTAKPGAWTSFRQEFETKPGEFWLSGVSFRLQGSGTAWLADLSLKEAQGGPELLWEAELNRPGRGFYNPLDCFLLDELVAAAEKAGIELQLCLLTRDLYMSALKDPSSPDYERAIQDATKTLRYAVARWGYSTSVAAWEYWNEMNPGLPTDTFYSALGTYLEQADPFHHMRTTSTWGPSARDCRHPKLDFADTHFYLRPSDRNRLEDEVQAVMDRTRWLREQAPGKPAHLGEFGLADEKWGLTEEMKRSPELADLHNALWASALSGASGTALFWWWERLDQRDFYPEYRPLSQFIAEIPWTSGNLQPAAAACSDPKVRLLGLAARDRAWLWLFDREASWAHLVSRQQAAREVTGATLEVQKLTAGMYQAQWWDTRSGKVIREEKQRAQNGVVRVTAPGFSRDIACRILRR